METLNHDNLLAGDYPAVTDVVTVLTGQNLARGAVLGKILRALGAVVIGGGNTGDGVVTAALKKATQLGNYIVTCIAGSAGAITTPVTGTADGGNAGANTMTGVAAGAKVKTGTYTMTCVDATNAGAELFQVTDPDGLLLPQATVAVAYVNEQVAFTINDPGAKAQVGDVITVLASAADGNAGTFSVVAPDGRRLADATVAVAYANDEIGFTIADGATDFVVGDTFTVPVTAGSGKYVAADKAAVDGSATAVAVLAEACDASAGDLGAVVFLSGAFNEGKLSFAAGNAIADHRAALRAVNIYAKKAVAA